MEPEMMWLRLNPDGTPSVEGKTKPYCYHIDQFSELQPIINKVVEYGQALGLDMIQGDHEDAPGQIELNFGFDRAERTADNLSTFRQIAKQVGREEGAFPCFMPKPFMGVSANGCHHNISLWRGGEDVEKKLGQETRAAMDAVFTYRKGGENTFLPLKGEAKPGPIGLNCIGGVVKNVRALTAIGSSTVNSYRRLWDTGFWAPVYADWGYQNRTCALRISAPGRFEYRTVDSAVNPTHLRNRAPRSSNARSSPRTSSRAGTNWSLSQCLNAARLNFERISSYQFW
jgi:glutamine synthetase